MKYLEYPRAGQPFVVGVNYWPRKKAMYFWREFDLGEVKEEFALISELGMKMVRIFLMWEDFQPERDRVSPEQLDRLEQVCDAAVAAGLKLNVTFFTGHMSGPNWAPQWMLAGEPLPKALPLQSGGQEVVSGYQNPYDDPTVITAEELLLARVVTRFKDHPGVGVWNLGNEPDLFAHASSDESGRKWAKRLADRVRQLDPSHPVTCGLHVPNLDSRTGLRVDHVHGQMDFAAIHGYSIYAGWLEDPLDPNFVPFLCALTAALSGKPVLMEEFGGCTNAPGEPSSTWSWTRGGESVRQFMASEEELAAHIEAILPKLVQVGATGAVLWCFSDYVEQLWDRPPCDTFKHERFFGLIRPDGSLKPHAEVVRRFLAGAPAVTPRTWFPELVADEYYKDPERNMQALYREFSLD